MNHSHANIQYNHTILCVILFSEEFYNKNINRKQLTIQTQNDQFFAPLVEIEPEEATL